MINLSNINPAALYNSRETSTLIGKSEASLSRYRWAGVGPQYIKRGNSVHYRGSDLLAWLEGGRVETTQVA